MRIISGSFKGKKILEPKDKKTRPLKDLTKESIFNIIKHSKKFKIDFSNSHILDLFSGVGSFGLECLSRDASKVTFVENYIKVLPVLKKNINNLGFNDQSQIIEKDIYHKNFFSKFNEKFDVIFMDPPYKEKNIELLLSNIKNEKILKKNGIIVIHRHKDEKDIIPNKLNVIEEKKYGLSKIIFLNICI